MVAVADSPHHWALQDANFNVLGIVESTGDLAERYEYTPYGQRTVFKPSGSNDLLCMAPVLESQRAPATAAAFAPRVMDGQRPAR